MNLKMIGAGLVLATGFSACSSGPYEPVLDGTKSSIYKRDLAECRQVSTQVSSTGDGATTGAILGGLIGGIDADSGDALEGVLVGAAIGGALGSAEEGSEVDEKRDQIVFNCLKGRGHNVVG